LTMCKMLDVNRCGAMYDYLQVRVLSSFSAQLQAKSQAKVRIKYFLQICYPFIL